MSTSAFATDGYQILRDVVDLSVIDGVRDFLNSRIAPELALAAQAIGCTDVLQIFAAARTMVNKTGRDSVDALSKEVKDTLTGHFSLRTRLSKELWDIPREPRLRAAISEVLGSEHLFLHMPPTARFVLPRSEFTGVPAHQDVSYNKHMSDFVTVWVPLVPIDEYCGGVTVYRGSAFAPEVEVTHGQSLWREPVSVHGYAPEHCAMNPGDALLLNKWIIHAATPNRSERTRLSIDFRFFGASDGSTKHYLDLQQWRVIPPRTMNA